MDLTGLDTYTGTFDITTLDDGNYTLRINATDFDGNENSSVTVENINVDDTVPVMNSLGSNITAANITRSDADVVFTLNAVEENVDIVKLNGLDMTPDPVLDDTYTYTGTPASLGCIPNNETDCTVTAIIIDMATNGNIIDYSFRVDDNAPDIQIQTEQPPELQIFNNVSVNISAKITDLNLNNVILYENSTGINESRTPVDSGNGVYSFVIDAIELSNREFVSYTFYAVDDIGNEYSISNDFTVNNRAPSFNSSNPIKNVSVDEEQAIPSFNIAGAFYDVDGDSLNYTYTPNPTVNGNLTITIDNSTGQVSITILDPDYFGVSNLLFRAFDPYGEIADSNTIEIKINNINE